MCFYDVGALGLKRLIKMQTDNLSVVGASDVTLNQADPTRVGASHCERPGAIARNQTELRPIICLRWRSS